MLIHDDDLSPDCLAAINIVADTVQRVRLATGVRFKTPGAQQTRALALLLTLPLTAERTLEPGSSEQMELAYDLAQDLLAMPGALIGPAPAEKAPDMAPGETIRPTDPDALYHAACAGRRSETRH